MDMRIAIPTLICLVAGDDPANYTDHVNEIPDMTQTRVVDSTMNHGEAMCAPVAVSNSLAYLAAHGYPGLTGGHSDAEAQIALARELAGPEFMQTDASSGTSKEGILAGVRRYVEQKGYSVPSLGYDGIQIHYRPGAAPEGRLPDLSKLKSRLVSGASVWLQIGWYRSDDGEYRKLGGHWVTMVGYESPPDDAHAAEVFVLHDPSSRSGMEFSNEYAHLMRIEGGRIHGWGIPQPASGFYRIEQGLALPEDADTAIVEGAIVFEIATL
jgi:hypothetical protein